MEPVKNFNFSGCSVDVLEVAELYFPTSLSNRKKDNRKQPQMDPL